MYHEGLMKGKDQCTAPIGLDNFGRRDLGERGYYLVPYSIDIV